MEVSAAITRVKYINSSLKSDEIIEYFNQCKIDKLHLLKLVIKISFDQVNADIRNQSLFRGIEEARVYSMDHYSDLIKEISHMRDTSINILHSNNTVHDFYMFHKIIAGSSKLSLELLQENGESQYEDYLIQSTKEELDDISLGEFLKSLGYILN